MKKEDIIEKHLRQKGLEMKDVYTFNLNNDETEDEILHQLLTSYILAHLGIKRTRILSKYYHIMHVFLK